MGTVHAHSPRPVVCFACHETVSHSNDEARPAAGIDHAAAGICRGLELWIVRYGTGRGSHGGAALRA
jgi:hypothetical protein